MPTSRQKSVALYVSVGKQLTHYQVDVDGAALARQASLTFPSNVQYVWPHPAQPYLYAACSNGFAETAGSGHCLVALRRDPDSGALDFHGQPVELPARPIHITVDSTGEHALVAYNQPSSLTVHRIKKDGSISGQIDQQVEPDTGIYAHQVRVTPSNKSVIVVARGNKGSAKKPEDPGALKFFTYRDGQLAANATVAPDGGYGFGPRHIDFHPSEPWIYASLESQNLLHMYRAPNDLPESMPAYVTQTLAEPHNERLRQRCGTIHVHPNGKFVYLANRASGMHDVAGQSVFVGGENNIAVYRIDQQSGEPVAIQHADTHGIVPRTFALDPGGRLLVAANSVTILAGEGTNIRTIPASLAVFKVSEDGKLDYVRKYDVDIGQDTMFWMGIVS